MYLKGWANIATFAKSLSSKQHSFRAVAWSRNIAGCGRDSRELLGYVRKEMADSRTMGRFRYKSQEAEAATWDDMACVQTRVVAEDHGVVSTPGESFTFFQKAINCAQPEATGAVIEVRYSERGGLPEGAPELAAEGEAVLKGLKQRREPAK